MSSAAHAASGSDLRLGAAIMASGTSSRFGSNKLLEKFEGRPLFEWVFDAIPADVFERVVVVTPYRRIAQRAARHGVTVVHNKDPEAGQANTVRLAMEHLSDLDGCMFCVCDQPYMSSASLRRMAEGFSGRREIRALSFDGRRGNPVLFGSQYYYELSTLEKNETGSAVIRRHMDALELIPAECATELMDIDSRREIEELEDVKNFFFTGARHAGKSTLLSDALAHSHLRATGITTIPYYISGVYTGYMLHALSRCTESSQNNRPISVFVPPDSCIPVPQTFSVFGTEYISACGDDTAPVVLLDELGKLEIPATDFQDSVFSLLDSERPVVGVLKDEDIGWLRKVRARKDTRVVRVLPDHRQDAAQELQRFLTAREL